MKMAVFWVVAPCSLIYTDVSEVLAATIIIEITNLQICNSLLYFEISDFYPPNRNEVSTYPRNVSWSLGLVMVTVGIPELVFPPPVARGMMKVEP
jgi:hypothetical protein